MSSRYKLIYHKSAIKFLEIVYIQAVDTRGGIYKIKEDESSSYMI
ncbi:MAG: hypothetical protein ACYCV0_19780 [Desulfitobacteriaceae bacterium]